MADYADNHERAVAHLGHPETLSERILGTEDVLRQGIIDHDDELAAHAIAVIEKAAATEGDAHHV
jgi:hypothetical protein